MALPLNVGWATHVTGLAVVAWLTAALLACILAVLVALWLGSTGNRQGRDDR